MDDDLVQTLRLRGADVRTALEAGLVEEDRVLYTFNVGDFMHLHGEYTTSLTKRAGEKDADTYPHP